MKNRIYVLMTAVIVCLLFCACKGYKPETMKGVVWGTTYSIVYERPARIHSTEIERAVLGALSTVDRVANAFNVKSELYKLNMFGRLEQPSYKFEYLLNASRRFVELTDGAFNPAVGPLVDYWGFGAGAKADVIDEGIIAKLLTWANIENFEIKDSSVVITMPGAQLDFAAIAKGYGVDVVSEALERIGVRNYMVEIGGEIRAAGHSPRGDEWLVQLDKPILTMCQTDFDEMHSQLAVLSIKDASLATSGNYRNWRIGPEGRFVYHTISPITGWPAESDLLSATIISEDAMTADALATASMVLGLEGATKLIEELSAQGDSKIYGAVFVTEKAERKDGFEIHLVNLDSTRVCVE